ncbi:MAG: hypothetical protein DRJ37_05145 [Thermoprotei archaeon]|nr:MAG: hypothetical protein DRJ37_05145 [Thermoprotei archaeon]
MRIKARCISCLVEVREQELERIFKNPDDRLGYMVKILNRYSGILKGEPRTPAEISTILFRYLKKLTGVEDPYEEDKKLANVVALRVYNDLRKRLQFMDSDSRLKLVVKASLAGNALDLGVKDYTFDFESIYDEIKSLRIEVDDSWIFDEVKGLNVVFLLDNSGEAVLDRLLAEELENRGATTIALVKEGAFQNDVTIEEAEEIGLFESFGRVVSTGTDGASVFLDEISEECKLALFNADLIVAKGMAHFEYLDEVKDVINKRIVFMLKAKCTPIADALKVPLNSYVVKVI